MKTMILIPLLATGCTRLYPGPTDPQLIEAQKNAVERPIGRYQIAGKREYSNGSEIYVLDSKTGHVCYFFVASGNGDDKAQTTDTNSCGSIALAPEYP